MSNVYIVNLGMAAKIRPAVVLSRFDPARPLAQVSLAPITTQYRGSQYEVPLGRPSFLREDSWVNVQSVAPETLAKLGFALLWAAWWAVAQKRQPLLDRSRGQVRVVPVTYQSGVQTARPVARRGLGME